MSMHMQELVAAQATANAAVHAATSRAEAASVELEAARQQVTKAHEVHQQKTQALQLQLQQVC